MNLVITLRLTPDIETSAALREFMERYNAACDHLSKIAFKKKLFGWYDLQTECYGRVRKKFRLSSRAVCTAVRKVCAAYKINKEVQATFSPLGSVPVKDHSFRKDDTISFYGFRIPFTGKPDIKFNSKSQAVLSFHKDTGKWCLIQPVEIEEPKEINRRKLLGVDLGINNIAVDSDGTIYSDRQINDIREKHRKLRSELQSKGTKSAKRKLKKRRRKEHRFAIYVNHCISKQIVKKAKDTRRGIALEDLRGIRERITVRKSQRYKHSSWAFSQLRLFVGYKAVLSGVPVRIKDPRDSSRRCFACGYIDKRNRRGDRFKCLSCGHEDHADHNAACNHTVSPLSERHLKKTG